MNEPQRCCYKHNDGQQVLVYRGVKRIKPGSTPGWIVIYKRRVQLFLDMDYSNNWRSSLQNAEEFLLSIYTPKQRACTPNYKLVVVKRPYSKDPNDTIERVRLVRAIGGYKYFVLDERMVHYDAVQKAYYEAEDYFWEECLKLKYIAAKPNARRLRELSLLNAKYGETLR